MIISSALFQKVSPVKPSNQALATLNHLNLMSPDYMHTPHQKSMFMAHACHESMWLNDFTENLNYSAKALIMTWPKRFLNPLLAYQIQRQPEKIANHVYGKRYGNNLPGDGWKFRGRGVFQTTFYDNYMAASMAIFGDDRLVHSPEMLEQPKYAALAALYYWKSKGMDKILPGEDFMRRSTLKLNGGYNGLADRVKNYNIFIKVIK